MPTATEVRAWARAEGIDVPVRGPLKGDLFDQYQAAHADGDEFPPDDDLEIIGPDDTVPIREEVRPTRKPAARSRQTTSDRIVGRLLGGGGKKPAAGGKGKAKPKPRVSLESFVARAYDAAGRVLQPLSPAAAACVSIQAPMAGVILEDKLRGTVVDRALQPVARAEDLMNAGFALVMPPLACMGIEMTYMQEQTPQIVMRRVVLMQMLREGLRAGLEVSEKYGEQIAAAAEKRARYDADVDALVAMIFPPTTVEPEPEMAGAAA